MSSEAGSREEEAGDSKEEEDDELGSVEAGSEEVVVKEKGSGKDVDEKKVVGRKRGA